MIPPAGGVPRARGAAPRVGILGGGQLGRMLLQSAASLAIPCSVLDPDPQAPCRGLCDELVAGSPRSFDDVVAFGRRMEVVTIEIENVHAGALERLADEGIAVRPGSAIVRTLQDKGRQKEFLSSHGFPTAEYALAEGRSDVARLAPLFPAVQKLRTSGYDGRGVRTIGSTAELDRAFDEPSVVERRIPFEKEISVIVARRPSGECTAFPPVEMMFHPGENIAEFLISPAQIPASAATRAEELARRIAGALSLTGVAAVEMFVVPGNGEPSILVNEIAPRPHNSGHHTIEANVTSQYEQHLRAILDLPLGSPAVKSPAVTVNILGAEGFTGPARYEGLDKVLALEGASVHLYGKASTKPFRKMGHVTICDADPARALDKARFVKQQIRVIA